MDKRQETTFANNPVTLLDHLHNQDSVQLKESTI